MNLPKIGVLVSGRSGGTNFQAILDAISRGELNVKVELLVATDELHGAVARARADSSPEDGKRRSLGPRS